MVLAMLIAGCSVDTPEAAADARVPPAAAPSPEPGLVLAFVQPPHHVQVGQTIQLTVASVPDQGNAGQLQFSSSDPAIATVTEQGDVHGLAPGRVYITASTAGAEALLELDVN